MYGKKLSIPIENAIRGFYSVTLSEEGYELTASVLTNELGFKLVGQDGSPFLYQISKANDDVDNDQVYQGFNIVDGTLPTKYTIWNDRYLGPSCRGTESIL